MINYVDKNGDGVIKQNDLNDQFYLGKKSSNHYNLGLNFGGAYKTLSLNVVMGMSWGGNQSIESAAIKQATANQNRPVFWADHWTPSNPNAKYPDPYYSDDVSATSDFWFVSPFTWNISSANLSYTLPASITKRLGMSSIRAYVVATNPINFVNPFPEHYRDISSPFGAYPNLRTVSFGLNLGF